MFEDIKAIGFDWDGTLVDSMLPKAESFAETIIRIFGNAHPVLSNYRSQMQDFYFSTRGSNRLDQLKTACRDYVGFVPTESECRTWSDEFTKDYSEKRLPLFSDSEETLGALKSRGYKLFLGSSVPHQDLMRTLEGYPSISSYFDFIFGSSEKMKKGVPLITYATATYNLSSNQIAFVGDSKEDVKVTLEAKSVPIGRVHPSIPATENELYEAGAVLAVKNLDELLKYF